MNLSLREINTALLLEQKYENSLLTLMEETSEIPERNASMKIFSH